jgi:hypothetical protein
MVNTAMNTAMSTAASKTKKQCREPMQGTNAVASPWLLAASTEARIVDCGAGALGNIKRLAMKTG